MGGIFKTIARIAPIAAAFIPGIGPLAGAAIGAAGGALSGGGLKGALLGGATGGLGAGGASSLLGAGGALGTNLAGAGLKTAAGALTGAAGGLYTGGGLKSALIGGGLGGLGGFASSAFGDPYGAIEAGDAAGATGLDRAAGSLAGSGVGQAVSKGVSALGLGSGAVEGAGTGGGSSTFSKIATVGGLLNSSAAGDDAEKALLEAQGRSEAALDPYLEAGKQGNARLAELLGLSGDPNAEGYGSLAKKFTPPDLANDPGYQFQLQQGTQALNNSLGARGKVFSGEALQEAQKFGTGLADQTYNDAFNRNRTENLDLYNKYAGISGTGQQAANALTQVYDNQGNAVANNTVGQSNLINKGLSSIFGADLNGIGAKQIVGYDPKTGKPIYADEKASIYGS